MTVPIPPVENTPDIFTVQSTSTNPPARTFSADDLERVRQQEKAKLYAELEKLREQSAILPTVQEELEALRKEREERAAAEAAAKAKAEEEARAKSEAEMSAKELLDLRNKEWEEKLASLQREREVERAALDKEREFAQLRDYTQARIAQESENIAPELLDLVDGNSREEVDASIERLKAKSLAIAEKVRGTQQQAAAQRQGVSPSGFNATGPMDMLPTTQNYSAEDIKGMSMKEYAEKIRGSFLGRGDARNRGLYG